MSINNSRESKTYHMRHIIVDIVDISTSVNLLCCFKDSPILFIARIIGSSIVDYENDKQKFLMCGSLINSGVSSKRVSIIIFCIKCKQLVKISLKWLFTIIYTWYTYVYCIRVIHRNKRNKCCKYERIYKSPMRWKIQSI